MITVGTIKEKFYDNETLIYKVDVSVFKSPGVKESALTSTIIEATACVAPGTYEPYNIDDLVYLGFVNNELGEPVILGKIAKKFDEQTQSSALNRINSLEVTNNAKLPKDINIGDLSYEDLKRASVYSNLNKDEDYATIEYVDDCIEDTKDYVEDYVVANPAVTSSETALSALQIGNNKFVIADTSILNQFNTFKMLNNGVSGFTSESPSTYSIAANIGVNWYTIYIIQLQKGTYSISLECIDSTPVVYTRVQVATNSGVDQGILCGCDCGSSASFDVSNYNQTIYIKICTDRNYSSYGSSKHKFRIMLNAGSTVANFIEYSIPLNDFILNSFSKYDGYYTTG